FDAEWVLFCRLRIRSEALIGNGGPEMAMMHANQMLQQVAPQPILSLRRFLRRLRTAANQASKRLPFVAESVERRRPLQVGMKLRDLPHSITPPKGALPLPEPLAFI